MNLYSALL